MNEFVQVGNELVQNPEICLIHWTSSGFELKSRKNSKQEKFAELFENYQNFMQNFCFLAKNRKYVKIQKDFRFATFA